MTRPRAKPYTRKAQQAKFLSVLGATANVSAACIEAKIGRMTAYDWRAADEVFAEAWARAYELGTEALEDEGIRRAHEGVDEPVFYQGEVCGHVRKFSDTLLIFMLKARKPEKYKERSAHELTGKDGAPLPTAVINVTIGGDRPESAPQAGPGASEHRD